MIYLLITKLADIPVINSSGVPTPKADSGSVDKALTILFSILGSIAVLIIMIAAIQYVFSSGEPEKVAQDKRGIIYAVVGLIVAAMSFALIKYGLGL